jgi:glycosyltransferase involved in cell wall biosynthesis
MHLDVVIPTHNRALMLRRTLDSLLAALPDDDLSVRVTVVDNNSTDDTHSTVQSYAPAFGGTLTYMFESRQGRSFALNAGITSTSGDLIGMIDDDEQIDPNWYRTIRSQFARADIDFIGGPYVPNWGADPPNWLPRNCLGAIGVVDGGSQVRSYDASYPGILMGGNAVISRAMLQRVGLYNTSLGRTGRRLLSGEDDEMYYRLLGGGGRGLYVPNLIIYHYIPPERLKRSYFRRWCFWRGVSEGLIDRTGRPAVACLGGIPRYLYGDALRGLFGVTIGRIKNLRRPAEVFAKELEIWNAVGVFYGRHFYSSANQSVSEKRQNSSMRGDSGFSNQKSMTTSD